MPLVLSSLIFPAAVVAFFTLTFLLVITLSNMASRDRAAEWGMGTLVDPRTGAPAREPEAPRAIGGREPLPA